MIRLDVKDYCQNCRYFKVKQLMMIYTAADHEVESDTTLKCENADKCDILYNHIMNSIKED